MKTIRCHAVATGQPPLWTGAAPSRAAAVLLATVLTLTAHVALAVSPVLAQSNTVLQAAAKINEITPKLIPHQTIFVGTYDAAPPRTFSWNPDEVVEYSPLTSPQSQIAPPGGGSPSTGDGPLWHSTLIRSLKVTYQFRVLNKPAYFSVSLSTPDGNGQMVEKVASSYGDRFSVTFSPGKNLLPQSVAFKVASQAVGGLVIRPLILPEVGSFVVPRLLIAVVYEPPGALSKASYSMTSTAGTVMSFGTARTSGIVRTVDDKELTDTIATIAKTLETISQVAGAMFYKDAGGATGPLGAVYTVFTDVIENTVMQKTVTSTRADTKSNGTFFSISTGAATKNTDALRYPGAGDVFIVLEDVLFVWGFSDGKVVLAPKGYKQLHALVSSELDAFVPPILAQKYRDLDPWFNPSMGPFTNTSTRATPTRGSRGGPVIAGEDKSLPTLMRFPKSKRAVCPVHAEIENVLKTGESTSSTTSQATTETVLTHVRGLWQTIAGTGDGLHSVTYSSSRETWQIDEQQTSVILSCDDSDGAFYVDLYLDTLFGTFFTVKGESTGYLAGSITDSQGRPMPNQAVSLQIGGQTYNARSDQRGRFRFVFKPLPAGSGTIVTGNSSWPVSYQGKPISNLKLTASTGTAPGPKPTLEQPGGRPTASSRGPIGAPPAASTASNHCCTIASVDARSGVVTARQVAGSETLYFTAPQSLLPNLRLGQKVWVDSRTQAISIEGAPNCCKPLAQPPAGVGSSAPAKLPGMR